MNKIWAILFWFNTWEPQYNSVKSWFVHRVSYMRVVWKVSDLAYNRWETRDNRLLGRDSDRSRCHLHTSLKLFLVAAYGFMDIGRSIRVCYCSVHGSMGCDQESFRGVWRWHHLLSGPYPTATCPEFNISCRLSKGR